MGKALFYHLTRSPAEALLPVLLTKALSAGWRVELSAPDPDRLDRLDQQLWQGDGFLPHGLSGGPDAGEDDARGIGDDGRIAYLADTRPLPDVAVYDQLLTQGTR